MTTNHPKRVTMTTIQTYRILFDGPPGPESGRFIETERLNEDGQWVGASLGEWAEVEPGSFWALVVEGRLL